MRQAIVHAPLGRDLGRAQRIEHADRVPHRNLRARLRVEAAGAKEVASQSFGEGDSRKAARGVQQGALDQRDAEAALEQVWCVGGLREYSHGEDARRCRGETLAVARPIQESARGGFGAGGQGGRVLGRRALHVLSEPARHQKVRRPTVGLAPVRRASAHPASQQIGFRHRDRAEAKR